MGRRRRGPRRVARRDRTSRDCGRHPVDLYAFAAARRGIAPQPRGGLEWVARQTGTALFSRHCQESRMTMHEVVSEEQWITARRALLAEEKAFMRAKDRLSENRRALPGVKIEKNFAFKGGGGPATLAGLFDGRS